MVEGRYPESIPHRMLPTARPQACCHLAALQVELRCDDRLAGCRITVDRTNAQTVPADPLDRHGRFSVAIDDTCPGHVETDRVALANTGKFGRFA